MLFTSEVGDSSSLLERGAYFMKLSGAEILLCVCMLSGDERFARAENIYLKSILYSSMCISILDKGYRLER